MSLHQTAGHAPSGREVPEEEHQPITGEKWAPHPGMMWRLALTGGTIFGAMIGWGLRGMIQ